MSKEKIIKSKERVKQSGEVFTPAKLASKVFERMRINGNLDPKNNFVDLQCGTGNLLVPVLKWKIKKGLSAWEALSTTFGADIMQDNVEECRKNLLKIAGVKQKRFIDLLETTVVCGNTLEQNNLFTEYEKKYMKDKQRG